jgi:hypothetical protein
MLNPEILKKKETKILISIIWGFGIACLFRKICKDRSCIIYKAPEPNYIKNNTWRFNNKCYKFYTKTAKCSSDSIE